MTKRTKLKTADEAPKIEVVRKMVHRSQIVAENADNKRFNMGDIEDLARSIRYQAKTGRPGGLLHDLHLELLPEDDPRRADGLLYKQKDGKRRLAGIDMLLANHKADPDGPLSYDFPDGFGALISPPRDRKAVLIEMSEANNNKHLDPLEEAAFYMEMRNEGMTVEGICAAVGRSAPHVTKTLNLVGAAPELKDAVKAGKVKGTTAKEIATAAKGDREKQKKLTEKVVAAGKDKAKLSEAKREIDRERVAKEARRGRSAKLRALSDADLHRLGGDVAEKLKGLLSALEMPHDSDLLRKVRGDEESAMFFTFGVLQGLKVAAGLEETIIV